MILVDTSVVIDYARTADPKLGGLFCTLPVAVPGAVRTETLHGCRTRTERQHCLTILDSFQQFATDETVWDAVGDNLVILRRTGLTVPFPDVLIATIAIAAGIECWARDKHFAAMQRVLPALRLFVEPP